MKYFTPKEFYCKCGKCGKGCESMSKALLSVLDNIREEAGIPFVILSSIRCVAHNKSVGGVPSSAHLTGEAVDIACTNPFYRFKILQAAMKHGIKRIGVYNGFIHIDVSVSLQNEVVWTGK